MTSRRLTYFGSGAFGLPTLARLIDEHDVRLVVTRPDRPAGRGRVTAPTPVADLAAERGIETMKPPDPNAPEATGTIRAVGADAFVVIAYGRKLGPRLLQGTFAVNLHASLLPKYRGAAPINRAILGGERETGVTVIALSQTIDAGDVLAQRATPVDPMETAGELEVRLAALGPDLVLETLERHRAGTLARVPQDDRRSCPAPRLTKAEGTAHFDAPASAVQSRVHGLTPWPGCTVRLDGRPLKLLRVAVLDAAARFGPPGQARSDGVVSCSPGAIRVLQVQPPGGRPMPWADYARGHALPAGAAMEPL